MSVKWYRFKLRPETGAQEVAELVQQQSDGFRKAFNWPAPGETVTDAARQIAARQYMQASEALISKFYFQREGGDVASYQTGVIAYNTLLPPEWREAAKSTLLPGDLPDRLRQWRAYADDIRLGYYEDFLYRLFIYEDYNPHHQGNEGWHQLLMTFADKVAASMTSAEDWAQTRGFKRTRAEITDEPVLPLTVPEPVFGPDEREADLSPATKAAFANFKQETERLMHQIIAWNRSVPEAHKLRIPTFIPAQVRMHQRQTAGREWLQTFFTWCEETVENGMGLFLAT